MSTYYLNSQIRSGNVPPSPIRDHFGCLSVRHNIFGYWVYITDHFALWHITMILYYCLLQPRLLQCFAIRSTGVSNQHNAATAEYVRTYDNENKTQRPYHTSAHQTSLVACTKTHRIQDAVSHISSDQQTSPAIPLWHAVAIPTSSGTAVPVDIDASCTSRKDQDVRWPVLSESSSFVMEQFACQSQRHKQYCLISARPEDIFI